MSICQMSICRDPGRQRRRVAHCPACMRPFSFPGRMGRRHKNQCAARRAPQPEHVLTTKSQRQQACHGPPAVAAEIHLRRGEAPPRPYSSRLL